MDYKNMNMFLRVLLGLGGVLTVLSGILFIGGGELFNSVFASEGINAGGALFSAFGVAGLVIGGLGCWGAFGDKKLPAGIFCAITLLFWPIGTLYAVVCITLMFVGNKGVADTVKS
ncbi:hypothetical protein BCT69_23920 [Enterovibrio norvegicus]|nr:hypothetical protein BCT69_23920 [Enterovibrio norvegicus]